MHERIPSGSSPISWIVSRPWRPHSRAALMASHGTLSSRSCCAAIGRMTSTREAADLLLELPLFVVELEIHCGSPRAAALTDQSIIVIPTARCAPQAPSYSPPRIAPYFRPVPRPRPRCLGGCSTDDEESRPPQLGVKARGRAGAPRSSASRRPPPATRCAWAAATRPRRRRGGRRALPRDRRLRPPDRRRARGQGRLGDGGRRLGARGPPDRRADPADRRRRHARRDRRTCSTGSSRRAPTSRRTPR